MRPLPKITFFNLPEDKKTILIKAAREEFSRVPLSQASITNIIKAAGIPRGSFYQYFEDKEDAFFFLLNEHVKENKQRFASILIKNNGDLFSTMLEFYESIISEEEENLHFLKNIFLNMTHQIESTYARSFHDNQDRNSDYNMFAGLVDQKKLNITNEQELACMGQIIIAVTIRSFIEKFARELPNEEALEHYKMEMELLKRGLAK
ncbi:MULTISPECIES: TetR/AcrR family transcriptional regulator [Bacillaceae]|uniref:TetR/AcrR family transcriptional regulator n=1 Tax=Bacillaceae TaxID=186817 RepID=UPI0027D2A51E|nr:TetR family transcriptional regulator [Cytobacillus gottheilii]